MYKADSPDTIIPTPTLLDDHMSPIAAGTPIRVTLSVDGTYYDDTYQAYQFMIATDDPLSPSIDNAFMFSTFEPVRTEIKDEQENVTAVMFEFTATYPCYSMFVNPNDTYASESYTIEVEIQG